MRVRTKTRRGLFLGACVLSLVLGGLARPAPSRAYESLERFLGSTRDGGGGGRLFTGVPRDGYNCRMCHNGQPDYFGLKVDGLPTEGYVPGQTYSITVSWSEYQTFAAEALSSPTAGYDPGMEVVIELGSDSTEKGVGAVVVAKNPIPGLPEEMLDEMLGVGTRCNAGTKDGKRAVDLSRLADGQLAKNLYRCSSETPQERCILHLNDCGASALTFDWIAPPDDSPVWFSASMVSTVLRSEDPTNDSVVTQVVPLQPATSQAQIYEQELSGECHVSVPAASRRPMGAVSSLIFACSALWLRRRRKDKR